MVSYEIDWMEYAVFTYVCWGEYLRPSNLGQCKYVLVTKQPISVHFIDITHRASVALYLSVSLFKIIDTKVLDCLLIVCVEKLNSFSPAVNLTVQSGLPYSATGTPHMAFHPMKHSGDKRELRIFKYSWSDQTWS